MKNGWMTENLHSCLRIPLQQQKITRVCVLLTLCFQLNSVRKLLRKKGKKWLIQNGWWFQCANGNSFIKCCFHGQHVILTKSMIFVRMILLSPIRFISFSQKRATDCDSTLDHIILLLRFQTSILIGITELSENFVLRGAAVIETKFWEEFRKIFSCILLVFHTDTERSKVELDTFSQRNNECS